MWHALLPLVGKVLEQVIPDPKASAEAKLKMMELAQNGELAYLDADVKLATGQIEVNKIEATGGWFRAGWRPLCGYVCVAGLAYQFLLQPLLAWASGIWLWPAPPMIELGDLVVLLGGMLGLGGFRTAEKLKNRG